VGVPFDLGVTHRPGARFGPRAVRDIARVGPFNHHTRMAPMALAKIADVGDVSLSQRYDLDAGIAEIASYYMKLTESGALPLTVGGDHSITYPILKALGRDEPVGLIHIDAHCDTGGVWGGSKFHHGGPFRQAALDGLIDPERTIQIGIRGAAEISWQFSYDSGMTVVHIEEIRERGVDVVIEKARHVVGDGPTYISFDVDGLDPVYAPGTGTPEIGGLTPYEVQKIIRSLKDLHLVGGDVVEVAPEYDPTTNTAQVAAAMLFEMLCVTVQSLRKRS
jgi:agmatinase